MPKIYHFLRITAFVHATEDSEKVLTAVSNILGGGVSGEITENRAEGIFHNPISYIVVEMGSSRRIESVVRKWEAMRFWKDAKEDLEDRLDEDLVYHVRLDKQKAFSGELSLWSGGEAVEVQLKPATFPSSRENAAAIILHGPP
ncbi:MAG: RNA-binding domain-containing protein [Thermoplasmatota archaeon]